MAGLWTACNFNSGESFNSCAIITKPTQDNISEIHHRMPLILSPNEGIEFLNDDDNLFLKNNKSIVEDDIDYFPVSKIVNNPKNIDESCIKQITL